MKGPKDLIQNLEKIKVEVLKYLTFIRSTRQLAKEDDMISMIDQQIKINEDYLSFIDHNIKGFKNQL